MKYTHHWYEDGNIAICTITHKGETYTGTAFCHTDDLDFCNKYTGLNIAEFRALIELYKAEKRKLRPQIVALERLQKQILHGAKCSPKSRENKVLWSEIRRLKNELATVNNELDTLRKELKDYIDIKDKFYKEIRAKRKVVEQVD